MLKKALALACVFVCLFEWRILASAVAMRGRREVLGSTCFHGSLDKFRDEVNFAGLDENNIHL
jgi:hypothetical protein